MSESPDSKQEHFIFITDDFDCISLEDPSPRRLYVARELPSLWSSPEKIVLPSSWENFNREPSETSVVTWRGCRVEIDPTLHGLFNRDVDIFVVLNFRNKSCVSCAFLALHSSLHSCSCIPRVLFVYHVIYYSSLPLAFSSAPTFFLGLY
jgi:hypothetical protein